MEDKRTLLAGVETPAVRPLRPFPESAVDFLDALSRKIRAAADPAPEIAAFGFWCRRSHLLQLKARHAAGALRLGRGCVFHIAPANVPAMFAYSFAAGLLAGNANIVRVSERSGAVTAALCGFLRATLDEPRFSEIKAATSIVTCPHDGTRMAEYMARCDAAVVWGGDETVRALRRYDMKPGADFLAFPDRWGMALLSTNALSEADGETFANYIHRFYNDTYVMDQNACSGPRLVLWLRDGGDADVRERFWTALAAEAERRPYPLDAYRAARKYERACLAAMTEPGVRNFRRYGGNLLYVLTLAAPPETPDALRGGFGLFYEAEIGDFSGLRPYVTEKLQTVSCLGIDRAALAAYLAEHGAGGVSRIVETGQALAFDTVWDGRDLIARLSREVSVP